MTDHLSNCGLPDGVLHEHNRRCYDAGRLAGRGELAGLLTQQALLQLSRELAAARALVATDELSPAQRFNVGEGLRVAAAAIAEARTAVDR